MTALDPGKDLGTRPLSPAQLLARLLTVDGAGSGLDADTVDGRNPGDADGLATLDSSGKVPSAQLPALALTDVHVVASEAAQLALTAQEGDVAIRSDENKSYVHNGGTAGTMADWSELLTPGAVLSVFGLTGAVTIPALTSEASADDADELAVYDASAGAHRRMTLAALLASVVRATAGVAWSGARDYTQADNTAATAITGAAWATADFQAIEILYTLRRGTTKARIGRLRVVHVNGAVTIDDDYTDEATGGALGCTFSAAINGSNVEVRLAVDNGSADDAFLVWEARAVRVYSA